MADRDKKYQELLLRLKFTKPSSSHDSKLLDLSKEFLETYKPNHDVEGSLLLSLVQENLPTAAEFFSEEFYSRSLGSVSVIRRTLDFYGAIPLTENYVESLKINPDRVTQTRTVNLIWVCALFKVDPDTAKSVINEYESRCTLSRTNYGIPKIPRTQVHTPSHSNSSHESESPGDDVACRLDATEEAIKTISKSIQQLSGVNQVKNRPRFENLGEKQQTSTPVGSINEYDSHSPLTPGRMDVSRWPDNARERANKSNRPAYSRGVYSSVGYIPTLPEQENPGQSNIGQSKGAALMKVYNERNQFAGTGDVGENLATYHQSFMHKCRTLRISSPEALQNLYVMFREGSQAQIFFNRHVLPNATTLDDAFRMLYNRFSSAERRDRLLSNWNNLQFKKFSSKPGATLHSALRDLCETASLLQLQLGPSYQDDQHLRDTLMNACKSEPWAHRLATMPTRDILDVQESLSRAITAEMHLEESRNKSVATPALVHFSSDRPGMTYRRYGKDSKPGRFPKPYYRPRLGAQGPDGKNKIHNDMRYLCRNCHSDSHLLRNCDKLSSTKRVQFASSILYADNICADSDECNNALDILQSFDDSSWQELENQLYNPADSDNDQAPNETHFTSILNSTVEPSDKMLHSSYSSLADISFSHSLFETAQPFSKPLQHQILFTDRDNTSVFEGICMDDGAERSVAGIAAYKRYCVHTNTPIDLVPSNETFRFGSGVHKSLGTTSIRFPIDDKGNFLEYVTDVVDVNIPILFGLDKMKEFRWYVNEVTDELCCYDRSHLKIKLKFYQGHLYYKWSTAMILFTRRELLKIHRRFAHPTATKLYELLRKAAPDRLDSNTRRHLEDIVKHCNSCQRLAAKPFVFQVTMPDNIVFNHEVYIDLCWIEPRPHKPVLHVVDRGTHFSAAKFVSGESAEAMWNAFIDCWVSIYIGFPNILSHDQGSNFTSAFFQSSCASFGIITKESPTESHNSLGPGERYHAPLRKIYKKVKLDFPTLENETALSIAVHGLNNTANPEGLIPTLLVFGSIPKIPLGNIPHLCPDQRDRFAALEIARREMESIVAVQRLKLAEKARTKQMGVFNICPGSEVLVYREKAKKWEGPYKLHKYDNYKTAYVQIDNGVEPFSITAVKSYLREESKADPEHLPSEAEKPSLPQIGEKIEVYWPLDNKYYAGKVVSRDSKSQKHRVQYDDGDTEDLDFSKETWHKIQSLDKKSENRSNFCDAYGILSSAFGSLRCHTSDFSDPSKVYVVVIVDDPLDPRFTESSRQEIKGLLDRGTYVVVNEADVPPGATILRSRVIHSIKSDKDGNEKCKTRLVIQGHLDPEKHHIVNEAPTILRCSTRIILALSATLGFRIWSRDVKQAFIQSEDKFQRELFVKPPKKPDLLSLVGQPKGLLQALKPLYGLAESPSYWWQTFKRYHLTNLGMTQSILDPCLFFKKKEGELIGLIGTLVDDTLGTGTKEFALEEETKSSRFDVKPRDESLPLLFGGSMITKKGDCYVLDQQDYSQSLSRINPSDFTPEEFAHLRGQLAYVATSTRPDVAYINAQLAQVISAKASSENAKLLNSAINTLQKFPRGLRFPNLDRNSLVIRGYADASFASNADLTSQLSMVVVLSDKDNNAAILHYASWKCRRITRSILAAEVYALSACYDYCYTVAHDLSNLLGRKISVQIFTDSKSIFDTITKLSSISEKRLLIDLSALREAYTSGEIENLGHILSEYNVADPLSKRMKSAILNKLLETGRLCHPVNQWIIHQSTDQN